jgi:hypothetical protein
MDALRAQEIGATVTPDVDNVAKSITDALNSVLYHDDKQIVLMTVTKTYVEEDVGVHVNIYKSESYKYPHDVKKGDMVEDDDPFNDVHLGYCFACGIAMRGPDSDGPKTICDHCAA